MLEVAVPELYTITIPAELAGAFLTGAVEFMGKAALVSAKTGKVVGAGTLARAAISASPGPTAAAAAAAGRGSLLGPLVVVVGATTTVVVGVVVLVRWRRQRTNAELTELTFETEAEAEAALAEVVLLRPGFKGEVRKRAAG